MYAVTNHSQDGITHNATLQDPSIPPGIESGANVALYAGSQ